MKTEAKDLGMETCPGEEVMKEEKFSHNRKPSHRHVSGELCNLRGQHNWGKKKKYIHMHTHTHIHTEYVPNGNCRQSQLRCSHLPAMSGASGGRHRLHRHHQSVG